MIPREGSPDRTLNVLELDAKVLEDNGQPGTFRWPEGQGVPHVDGSIVSPAFVTVSGMSAR